MNTSMIQQTNDYYILCKGLKKSSAIMARASFGKSVDSK